MVNLNITRSNSGLVHLRRW